MNLNCYFFLGGGGFYLRKSEKVESQSLKNHTLWKKNLIENFWLPWFLILWKNSNFFHSFILFILDLSYSKNVYPCNCKIYNQLTGVKIDSTFFLNKHVRKISTVLHDNCKILSLKSAQFTNSEELSMYVWYCIYPSIYPSIISPFHPSIYPSYNPPFDSSNNTGRSKNDQKIAFLQLRIFNCKYLQNQVLQTIW